MSQKTLSKQAAHEELAKRHFDRFLDFVYITEPRPDGSDSHIAFEKWSHLLEAARELAEHRCLVIPKPRQIGFSWLIAAWSLWNTLFKKNFKTLLFSQGEMEAYDLLAKCVYIWTHLPAGLKQPRTNDSKRALEFGDDWWIRAYPSTPKAGHGTTAGLVVFDEADYHEYIDPAYAAVKPTIDDVGGQIVFISKVNPHTPQSLFKRIARGAPDNGFKCLFYPWDVRPNRSAEWFEEVRRTYDDPFEFEKAYPGSLEEALAPPKDLQVIAGEIVERFRADVRAPLEAEGITRIWQHVVPGRRYVAATDVAHGVGLDRSVTVIYDVQSGQVVADVLSRTTEPLQFTVETIQLLRKYSYPVWAIEANEWGRRVIDRAQALNYKRIWHRPSGEPGWLTNAHTRPNLWGSLLEACFHGMVVCHAREFVDELANLVRNPANMGRIEAAAGSNDDYCTALGIALCLREFAVRADYSEDYFPTAPRTSTYKWRGYARR